MAGTKKKLSVSVLSGGPDAEAMISRKSAEAISDALRTAGHQVFEVDLPKSRPELLLHNIPKDHIVFPALHGPWGEGGGAQRELMDLGLSFVGFTAHAASAAMDKAKTRQIAATHNVSIAEGAVVDSGSQAPCPPPCILKPLDEGCSVGLQLLKTETELTEALHKLSSSALCEAFVPGREFTVPWLLGKVLPIIEIVPAEGLYDHEAKYVRDDTTFTVAPEISEQAQVQLRNATLTMANALNARHLGRADFILGPQGPVFLEWNAMPGFTTNSLLPRAAAHSGIPLPQLTDRLVLAAHAEGPLQPISDCES